MPKLITVYLKYLPIIWFAGISIPVYYIFLIIDLFKTRFTSRYTYDKLLFQILILFIFYYFVRIIILVSDPAVFIRFLSSMQGLASWVVIFITSLAICKYNPDKISFKTNKIITINIYCLVILLVISLFTYYIFGVKNLALSTIFSSIDNLPDHILALSTNIIYSNDYIFGSELPRLRFLSPYPNALALFISLLILLKLYIDNSFSKNRIIVITSLLILFLTMSRTTIISLIVIVFLALVMSILFKNYKSLLKQRVKYIHIRNLFIVIITGIILSPLVFSLGQYFMNYRDGSTSTRIISYVIAIENTYNTNAVFGLGYKFKSTEALISVGSHSTPIGVFVKTGFIGLIFYSLFWARLLYLTFKNLFSNESDFRSMILFTSIVLIFIWQLTEDLDALLHIPVLFGIVIGLLFNNLKSQNK